jgi:hypothetical protein
MPASSIFSARSTLPTLYLDALERALQAAGLAVLALSAVSELNLAQ